MSLPVWAVGLRWNLGYEPWLQGQDLISDMSFRASYGFQGNVAENISPDLIATITADPKGQGYMLTIDNLPDTLFDTTPERLLELKDEVKLIRAIIDSLPNLQRIIMRMKDVEGYETEEIVQITGCNAEAIRSNLSRARKRVRDVYLKIIDEKKRRNRP